MKVDELEKIINNAFEDKQNISDASDKKILDAINKTIDLTDKGTIRTNKVVIASGIWGPLMGDMAGVRVPLMPLEHPLLFFGPYLFKACKAIRFYWMN